MLPQLVASEDDALQLVLPWADQPHLATWQEFEVQFSTTPHRRSLLALALSRLHALEAAGVPLYAVWINGSYVTGREHPNDIDIVVLIDGERLASARDERGMSPAEWVSHMRDLTASRYELGGTTLDHRTEFQYVVYFPGHSTWGATTEDELDHWFTVWSRLEVGPRDRAGRGKMVDDAKGFVEVRW